MTMERRDFLKLMGAGLGVGAAGALFAQSSGQTVVVIGGGYGGATAAKYLKLMNPGLNVVLIERDRQYVSCPLSNEVLNGDGKIENLTFGYDGLKKRGITVVHDTVTAVDPQARKVTVSGGSTFTFDRAIIAPGIDFQWNAIKGYDEAASHVIPHAWKAGAQTTLLANQIKSMKDGGVVIITAPDNPFRCPPGPYERASLIANYLKRHKPRSKIIILDTKENFSKKGLFTQGWKQHYDGMIEWVPASKGGEVESVDVATRTVTSVVGTKHQADVLNIIPPQYAGKIAHTTGLVNPKGWCPVNFLTFESTQHKGIHVIGDASVAGAMPKSGYAASSQAKVAAAAVVASLRGVPAGDPSFMNACYSLITPEHGVSVTGIYTVKDNALIEVPGSGGVSPMDATPAFRKLEVAHAKSWFKNVTTDMFE